MSTGTKQDFHGECGHGDYRLKHPPWKKKSAFHPYSNEFMRPLWQLNLCKLNNFKRNTEKSSLMFNWWPSPGKTFRGRNSALLKQSTELNLSLPLPRSVKQLRAF